MTEALARACADLDALRAQYALVGGLAVSVHAEPRLTRDVDVAVATADDTAAEALVRGLVQRGYALASVVEQVGRGRLATARLVQANANIVVDILFASSGLEPEIVAEAKPLEILPGLRCPVARPAHLIAMKLLARDDRHRPQDLDDIYNLLATTSASERARVAPALRTITARGYARGRDLADAWRDVLKARVTR